MKTITTHYINGAFVESHGQEVMDIVKPTNGQVIGRVKLADEEDTRRAIAAAKTAFASFGRSTKEERAKILRRLHQAASARLDDLTAAMVEEYGGVVQFAGLIVQSGINAFLAAEQALGGLPLTSSWGTTTVTLELGGKSPTILLDDAVLDQAIPSALVMAFMNSGQACADSAPSASGRFGAP